uniref:Uncharacterized protein n=1 Tax=Strigamia maritima TaxID=126957 RepID=T1IU34_STRMM
MILLFKSLRLLIHFWTEKNSPCVDISSMEKCHLECYLKEIKRQNFTCQLPYLPKSKEKNCLANNAACNYSKQITKIAWDVNPHYTCNCARECSKIIMLLLSEYFSYDFIALLCDIGGFLSFYTGISCIVIIESIFHTILKGYEIVIFYNTYKSRYAKHVIRKTEILWKKINKDKDINLPQLQSSSIVEKIVLICSFLSCCYFVYHRIVQYTEYPTNVTIKVSQDNYPKSIIDEKEKMMIHKKMNVNSVEDVDFLHLLDAPSKYANDTRRLWEATGDMENFQSTADLVSAFAATSVAIIKPRLGNMTYFDTVFGKCIKVESDQMEYHPSTALVVLVYQPTEIQKISYSIFLMKTEERINLKITDSHPHNVVMNIKLSKQMMCKMNTPTNPCVTFEQFSLCEENCFESKLMKENINCKLPFINSSHLPNCKTSIEAKKTSRSYLNIHLNIDTIRDCGCSPPFLEMNNWSHDFEAKRKTESHDFFVGEPRLTAEKNCPPVRLYVSSWLKEENILYEFFINSVEIKSTIDDAIKDEKN